MIRFLEVNDIRQALTIQKQFGLTDVQVSRYLVVYHYRNKNKTEQLIIEDKFGVRIILRFVNSFQYSSMIEVLSKAFC